MNRNPIGRPRNDPKAVQKYQLVAVYPETHKVIKDNASASKLTIVDYLDKTIKPRGSNGKA